MDLEKELIPAVVSVEDGLVSSITDISSSLKKMRNSGMNDRLIILLLHDASGVPKGEVKKVITGMESLEKIYLSNTTKGKRK